MLYCQPNISFAQIWRDHGISHCFIDTVSTTFIFLFILVFGGIQYGIYRKYSTAVDRRLLKRSRLFVLQIVLSVFLPVLALVRLVLQGTVLGDRTVYGYMLTTALPTLVIWPLSLGLLFLERWRALPSIPTSGHGLVLLFFWTSVFINENLVFLNLRRKSWWFDLFGTSDKVELSLFVLRYAASMLLFLLGLKAPGLPSVRDYFIYSNEHQNIQDNGPLLSDAPARQRSAFSNFWYKMAILLPFMWPKKNFRLQLQVILCVLLLVVGRVATVYVPIMTKNIINSLTPSPGKALVFRWDYILIYVGLWFLQGQGANSFLSNVRSFLWIRVQQYTVKEIQVGLYTHLHGLSLRWHLSRKTGEVLRVVDRGTSSITSLLSYILFNIVPTVADISIAVIYFITAFNVWFGVIVFATMFLYLGFTIAVTEWRTKFRRSMNRLDNATEAKAVDALLNFETVKYYNAEGYEIECYKRCIDNYQVEEWKSTASMNFLNSLQNGIITLGVMAGTLLCAHMVVAGEGMNVGDYVLFTAYILQLYTPLNYFGTIYRMIQTAFIDMENMFDLMKVLPDIQDEVNAPSLQVRGADIEVKNVNFAYLPERVILRDISFTVPAGNTVALVGPSGSGKSTIIRLLFRLYDVLSGDITIDKQNIAKVRQKSLRSQIGVVPQDTVLFNDSIRYNIRYGRIDATEEDIEEAAQVADIHSQIQLFPNGYDTIVGERGLKVSGGEKQRVAIARTVLKNPSIVLLDEATSSLDTQTERNIQTALNKMCANRTTVVVAHRLSTIIHADMILVLKEGQIVERGSHEELLASNGLYCNMWQQQLKSSEED